MLKTIVEVVYKNTRRALKIFITKGGDYTIGFAVSFITVKAMERKLVM